MEQRVVPTSPKSGHLQEQKKKKEMKDRNSHLIFYVIVISLVLGSLTGFVGFLIAANIPSSWPVLGELNVVSVFEQERQNLLLSSRQQDQTITTQAPYVIEQIVPLYNEAPTLEKPQELVANAVILTSDGWMATATAAFPVVDDKRNTDLVAVLPEGETATIERTVDDTFTGITYFKVEATNLPIVRFDMSHSIPVGKPISVVEKDLGSYIVYARTNAGELYRSGVPRNTLVLQQFAVIGNGANGNRIGSPVFANNGELLGILVQDGALVQASLISGALQSIIQQDAVVRSTHQIFYVNLDRVTSTEKVKKGLPENGLYITDVKKPKLVGLEPGDVITSVNNTFVDEFFDLGVYIHSKPVETVLYMTVKNNGEERGVELKL